jgi:hypothetical protein
VKPILSIYSIYDESKNAMVCNISMTFVFFTNNFVNSPKKRPEKWLKKLKVAPGY